MPVTADRPAPYAPPTAVIEMLDRNRAKGIPNPINGEVLERAGVSPSLVPRTLQALQTLDLIKEDGSHTDVLEGLRRAPEGEYQDRLVQWLDAAYADARQYVDPATDSDVAVRDAFRNYNPFGQQSRMVTLFLGLYERAGVVEKKPPAARATAARVLTGATRKPSNTVRPATSTKRDTVPRGQGGGHNIGEPGVSLPSPISGLLAKLPREDVGWTAARRDKFLAAFEAMLDFCYPLIEREPEPASTAEEATE